MLGMSYFKDKILGGGEITTQGKFTANGAFYIALAPKTTTASNVAVLNVKLSSNAVYTDFPFAIGTWNPVLVNEIDVKSSDLSDYRIFWGEE